MTDIDIEAARSDPKLANVVYHDWEAASYDDKWSISFDDRCIDYARDRFAKIAGTGRLAVRRRARDRRGHRLLPAQPEAGRRAGPRHGHRHLAGHGRRGAAQRGAARLR
jgi:hypothetical protein